ncbi:MAG TPA: hypothetical protein V6D48_14650 [Oculatellaceae cyanobacterium]
MKHILETIFDQDADSALHKALMHNGISSPHDLCMEDEGTFDSYQYPTGVGNDTDPLPKGNIGLLKAFKAYVAHQTNLGRPITDDLWLNITRQEFDDFRISPNFTTCSLTPQLPPRLSAQQLDPVREFRRGIKRDITQYITFKDDAAWDNWNRSTIAQARAQDVEEVLNPSYIPTTKEETDLFGEKQKFMYAVFEKTLLTDKGKALVRAYQKTYDAQQIYKELQEYALLSTKATMDASSLLSYITTSNLGDGKWKGTTHAYILHWQDQVRKYHDLSPSQALSDNLQRILLENAVHPVSELRSVKVQTI